MECLFCSRGKEISDDLIAVRALQILQKNPENRKLGVDAAVTHRADFQVRLHWYAHM